MPRRRQICFGSVLRTACPHTVPATGRAPALPAPESLAAPDTQAVPWRRFAGRLPPRKSPDIRPVPQTQGKQPRTHRAKACSKNAQQRQKCAGEQRRSHALPRGVAFRRKNMPCQLHRVFSPLAALPHPQRIRCQKRSRTQRLRNASLPAPRGRSCCRAAVRHRQHRGGSAAGLTCCAHQRPPLSAAAAPPKQPPSSSASGSMAFAPCQCTAPSCIHAAAARHSA